MNLEQVLVGGLTAALCVTGLWHDDWLLTNTRKGRKLIAWFGDDRAPWVLRTLLALGLGFGLLLATGILNPIRWDRATSAPRVGEAH
jgi:hypothetical protein